MYKHTLWAILFLGAQTLAAMAPIAPFGAADERAQAYIQRYISLAIEEMNNFGIPASITMAQAILESNSGQSQLASVAKNHFGIKYFDGWKGETVMRETVEYDENHQKVVVLARFCKFENDEDSFREHTSFLQKERYESLFKLEIMDYEGWAIGLQACGYATDPQYPNKLMNIIEKYDLAQFDQNLEQIAQIIPPDVRPENVYVEAFNAPEFTVSLRLPEPPAPSQRALFLSRNPVFAPITIR